MPENPRQTVYVFVAEFATSLLNNDLKKLRKTMEVFFAKVIRCKGYTLFTLPVDNGISNMLLYLF